MFATIILVPEGCTFRNAPMGTPVGSILLVLRSCIPESHPPQWTYARAYRRAQQRSDITSVHIPRAIAQHGTSKTSHMAHFHLRQTGFQLPRHHLGITSASPRHHPGITPASPRRTRAKVVFLNDLRSCQAAEKDL